MYHTGVTKGCSTTPLNYCPNQPVTRVQMASFFVCAINHPPPLATPHKFVPIPIPRGFFHATARDARTASRLNMLSKAPAVPDGLPARSPAIPPGWSTARTKAIRPSRSVTRPPLAQKTDATIGVSSLIGRTARLERRVAPPTPRGRITAGNRPRKQPPCLNPKC